jgi:hypothetical protein
MQIKHRSPVETILAAIAGQTDKDRLLLVHQQHRLEGSRVTLRQQTWSEGLGWSTQNSIELTPQQIAELRSALGCAPSNSLAYHRDKESDKTVNAPHQPCIVRLHSA